MLIFVRCESCYPPCRIHSHIGTAGRTVTLEVDPTCPIEDLRAAVETIFNVPVAQQRLVYNTKILDDGKTIADYDIGHESTVHLILRILGGKNPRGTHITTEQRAARAAARRVHLQELRARVAEAYSRQESLNEAADRVSFELDNAGDAVEDLRAQIEDMEEDEAHPQAILAVRQRYRAARQLVGELQGRMNEIERDIERIAGSIRRLENAIEEEIGD